jgi:hypothetical protein
MIVLQTSRIGLTAALTSIALVAACSSSDESTGKQSDTLPQGSETVKLDPSTFTTKIDNPYSPMVPGTQMTFREVDGDGSEATVVVTVTSRTKKIANGVTARVVRDTVTEDGEIVEDTFDWFAQDAAGNVWYLGENTAEFENGKKASSEGSFEAGVDGAQAGVIMPANPKVGMAYRQEFYKGHAEDNGAVLGTDEMVEVPYKQFSSALMTKETNGIEPDALELKFYVRGIGNVLSLDVSGGSAREELVSIKKNVPAETGTGPLGAP